MNIKVNNLIKEIREQKKLSQENMARDLKVSSNYISLIENNKKKPGMPFLKKVSSTYNVPLILLLQETMIPKASNKKEKEVQKKLIGLIADLEKLFLNA